MFLTHNNYCICNVSVYDYVCVSGYVVAGVDIVCIYEGNTIWEVILFLFPRWINDYCKGAKFIMKADDDILVSVLKFVSFIKVKIVNNYYPSNTIFCNVWYGRRPIRKRRNKWYISKVRS